MAVIAVAIACRLVAETEDLSATRGGRLDPGLSGEPVSAGNRGVGANVGKRVTASKRGCGVGVANNRALCTARDSAGDGSVVRPSEVVRDRAACFTEAPIQRRRVVKHAHSVCAHVNGRDGDWGPIARDVVTHRISNGNAVVVRLAARDSGVLERDRWTGIEVGLHRGGVDRFSRPLTEHPVRQVLVVHVVVGRDSSAHYAVSR